MRDPGELGTEDACLRMMEALDALEELLMRADVHEAAAMACARSALVRDQFTDVALLLLTAAGSSRSRAERAQKRAGQRRE